MLDTARTMTDGWTLAMHHDLWVELASTEMVLEKMGATATDQPKVQQLEQRCVELRQSLQLLPH